jgi:diguanylate cyclase (GGDEF)-like protein
MANFRRPDQVQLLSGLVAGLIFAWCSWTLGNGTMQRVLEADAMSTADSWGDFLAVAIPDLGAIMAGEPISLTSQNFLSRTTQIGEVYRYRLYDEAGVLRLDSRPMDEDAVIDEVDSAGARRTAVTGETALKVGNGNGFDRPSHYAEASVQLRVEGQVVGTIEVYVDQVEKSAAIRTVFIWAALTIAAWTGLAFTFPMAAYLLSTRKAEQKIAFVAQHDDLTLLHNRSAFKGILDKLIASPGNLAEFRIFFVNLDKFKGVNESRGHATGDAVLKQAASRLRDLAGLGCEVCRLGGDEFAIYQPTEPGAKIDLSLGERIVAELHNPFAAQGSEVVIGASVGISSYPADAANSGDLFKAADIALNEAKQGGGGHIVVFERLMEERITRRLMMENRIRTATVNGDFSIYYQPLLDRNGLAGFEALLRLWDDQGNPVSPSTFIFLAERMGLIGAIGKRTLEIACRTAAGWPDRLKVAVNLSALQFEDGELVETVRAALAVANLDASRLELEITESVLIADTVSVLRQLEEIKQLGVSIALDDFGTGYSSLSYLWMFPFDRLKVDRSFISRLSKGDDKSREVLSSILAIGKSLEMSITAEGVETAEQSGILQAMKVDTIQGYLYGRPTPEADVAASILRLRGGFHSPCSAGVVELGGTEGACRAS